jgi:lipopolysaccharide export LptBFGC system permease protein LptF
MILYNGGERLLHARYLLPVVPLALAAAVAALSLLSRRAAYTVLGSLLVVWFGISFAGLAVVLRFFGT